MTDPEQNTTAALTRIEAKLDQILERLKWAPESMADRYGAQQQISPEENQNG